MVVEHKHRIGFEGTIMVEPKPFEPTKHQYDRDTAAVYAFLERFGLTKEVRVNIEVNHATLAGLDFEHEIAAACAFGILGSLDINRGDPRSGWDTDRFPNNAQDLVPAMLQVIENGGLGTGGFNFDAKLRRQSVDPDDLYLAHIGGMDTLARALLAAADVVEEGKLQRLRLDRCKGWDTAFGRDIDAGKFDLSSLCDHAVANGLDPRPHFHYLGSLNPHNGEHHKTRRFVLRKWQSTMRKYCHRLNGHSTPLRLISGFPFYVAADAWKLLERRRAACQYRICGSAHI